MAESRSWEPHGFLLRAVTIVAARYRKKAGGGGTFSKEPRATVALRKKKGGGRERGPNWRGRSLTSDVGVGKKKFDGSGEGCTDGGIRNQKKRLITRHRPSRSWTGN